MKTTNMGLLFSARLTKDRDRSAVQEFEAPRRGVCVPLYLFMLFVVVGLQIDQLVVHPHLFSWGEQSFGASSSTLQMACVLTRRLVVKATCCT